MSGGGFRTADYDFEVPEDRIAQRPAVRRDESRLMVVTRATGVIEHKTFRDLPSLIPRGDTIVLNTSRVIRARLLGARAGGGKAELLLLEPRGDGSWESLVRPSSRIKDGAAIRIADGVLAIVTGGDDAGLAARGSRIVRFESSRSIDEILEEFGHIPLPPYIERTDEETDAERYQTVYAEHPGSVAAPTAGLHFTPEVLAALEDKGVHRADVLLHVGAGTFKPVEAEDPAGHEMHSERFELTTATASLLNATRESGHAIWAVGTTSLRVLESVVDQRGRFAATAGTTRIFIRPPHIVRGADRLLTNFHLPRSTLLMLVAAFAGYDLIKHAYAVAVAEGYRFYSYGDAMVVT